MVFNSPAPASFVSSCKRSRVVVLYVYLGLHTCGCISFSIRPSSYPLLIFCLLSFLPLFLVIQLFHLWQREHSGRQEIEARVCQTEEKLHKFMAETTSFSSSKPEVCEVNHEEPHGKNDNDDDKRRLRRPECAVCFEEMGDRKLARGLLKFCQGLPCWKPKSRNRALLIPCGHASICTCCALKLWKSSRNRCPICRAKLTKRPKRLPTVIHT